ncbi:MAG TPA: hypothetical protein VGW38_28100, partial [Chloroflexota bacterium]|nr:hypothetical protein [Chloroflexota bacterium]
MIRFGEEERTRLQASGWVLADVPPGLTLARLRAAGLPFKSSKFFDRQSALAREVAFSGGDIAYRPGLMPGSLNQPFTACGELLSRLSPLLHGCVAMCAPAAVYAWLLSDHHQRTGQWLLQGCFTWAVDVHVVKEPAEGDLSANHLVVGVFGTQRPLIVSPLPEGRGAGVGLMPIIVPA